ncbi:carbohydrate kinase PfkB family [Methanobrevibacter ruminantium M1]|uniref:Carbohydrate kinase PfkB family n=1 Tax=Methanobrevibacter ruminantium (strain ATCC 35063 / DSM 1093 / JCM 13430 / OCM 146 / M1) TaxID=634498 RepID=D3E3Y1_METRM|nr:carbohydrate kinase family protein [Methanobrevibacter ruminantium]ADC47242.1 carbohydrate kinase PfkB family [Methanobrevibacter ruminantium M1]
MDEKDLKSSNNVTAEDLGVDEIVYDAINVDVIGFGALNVDKLYRVGHIAEIDEESFIKGEEQSPGGSAANTIIGLSKLGCSTSYIGKIADDEEGDLLEYNLMVNNVYLTNLIYADSGNSGKVLGFVSDEGDRALYVDPGVNDDITIDEINPLNVNACKILHYTSFVGDSFNAQKELLNVLGDDIVLSFDPGMLYVKKGVLELKEILERTNILLINENELKILFEDHYKEKLSVSKDLTFRDLAVFIRDDGIDTVVVKRGENGVYAINKDDDEVKAPAFKCEAVDTTAAGDSFNAGFLYSYLKGYDLAKSCLIANWVASRSVQAIGISGLPNLEELEEFISSL